MFTRIKLSIVIGVEINRDATQAGFAQDAIPIHIVNDATLNRAISVEAEARARNLRA